MSIIAQLIAAAEPAVAEPAADAATIGAAAANTGTSTLTILLYVFGAQAAGLLSLVGLGFVAVRWLNNQAKAQRAEDQERAATQRTEDQEAQRRGFQRLEDKVDGVAGDVAGVKSDLSDVKKDVTDIKLKMARREGHEDGHDEGYQEGYAKGRRDERAAQAARPAPSPAQAPAPASAS